MARNVELSRASGIAGLRLSSHGPLIRWWVASAAAACIGLAGVLLGGIESVFVGGTVMPLTFGLGMSAAVVWNFLAPHQMRGERSTTADHYTRVRRISRSIYLILYLMAGAKQIEYLSHEATGGNFAQSMQDLRPYLAYAIFALFLARGLEALAQRTGRPLEDVKDSPIRAC